MAPCCFAARTSSSSAWAPSSKGAPWSNALVPVVIDGCDGGMPAPRKRLIVAEAEAASARSWWTLTMPRFLVCKSFSGQPFFGDELLHERAREEVAPLEPKHHLDGRVHARHC